jgi:hypothetical protein
VPPSYLGWKPFKYASTCPTVSIDGNAVFPMHGVVPTAHILGFEIRPMLPDAFIQRGEHVLRREGRLVGEVHAPTEWKTHVSGLCFQDVASSGVGPPFLPIVVNESKSARGPWRRDRRSRAAVCPTSVPRATCNVRGDDAVPRACAHLRWRPPSSGRR